MIRPIQLDDAPGALSNHDGRIVPGYDEASHIVGWVGISNDPQQRSFDAVAVQLLIGNQSNPSFRICIVRIIEWFET